MNQEHLLRAIVALLSVLAVAVVAAALHAAGDVIVPFALAFFAATTLEPLVRVLHRLRVPRWVSGLLVVGLLFFAVQVTVGLIAASAQELETRLPTYLDRLQSLVNMLPLGSAEAGRMRVDTPEFWMEILPAEVVYGSVGSWASSVTAFVARASLVLLLTVALIIARQRFDQRLGDVAGSATGRPKESVDIIEAIDRGIQRYMQYKTLLSLANGLLFGCVLALFGVDFPVLWGFVLLVLNYIPVVGPVLATVPPLLVLFLQNPGSPAYAAFGAVVAGGVPFLFANVIEPKVFGDNLNLNFFAVIFALLLWGVLWGVAGAFLAVPITMGMSLICREVPALRPVHDLLRA